MGTHKAERVFPPKYVSLETLAYRLDCPVATIERYVREGVLPRPRRIGALVRWRFAKIEAAIEADVVGVSAMGAATEPLDHCHGAPRPKGAAAGL